METPPIIFFDGMCNLCNGAVTFLIKRDKNKRLRFASLQSAAAVSILKDYTVSPGMQSFLLLEKEQLFSKSTAALRVCRYLTRPWPMLYALIIIPKFISDGVYDFIARNRYRWFGKTNECVIPTPELQARFLN